MDDKRTELVYILDMSGSMRELARDTIGGYNSLLDAQRKVGEADPEMKASVTTVLFDDRYIILHDRKDIREVADITEKEYCPRGMTAMLDAVGRTITHVGQELAAMPEAERPGLVSVTIVTDGYENASREYTWNAVQAMIREQREKYSWVFAFIGANIDVERASESLGIDSRLAKAYTASSAGTQSVYTSVSNGVTRMRGVSASTSTSAQVAKGKTAAASWATADSLTEAMAEELDGIQ